MKTVSIVIPFYNTDIKYFRDCLDSIAAQNYKDYEVIVIDDGSEEYKSFEAEKLLYSYPFESRFIKQENGGVSNARNRGVEISSGDYIMFLDSDDIVDSGFFRIALDRQDKANYIIGKIKPLPEDHRGGDLDPAAGMSCIECVPSDRLKARFLGAHEVDRDVMSDFRSGPVTSLVKRDVALLCPFDSSLDFGEDTLWNLAALGHVDKVDLIHRYVYGYRKVEGSLSTKYRPDMLDSIASFLSKARGFVSTEAECREWSRLVCIWAFNVIRNYSIASPRSACIGFLKERLEEEPWRSALGISGTLGLPKRYALFSSLLKDRHYLLALSTAWAGRVSAGIRKNKKS